MKIVALLALFLVLLSSFALAAPRIEVINSASAVETRNGALVAVPLNGAARPGQRLRYTIVAKNNGDHPAAKLVPATKLPAGEHFVGGSAGPLAEYSIDGGKTWSRQPMVSITSNGTATQRPALPAEYNALRWVTTEPIAPNARAVFTYDVIVE